jgi:hypothetical protein
MARTKSGLFRSAFFRRRNLLAFAVCLAISSLLWLLMAFNNFYTSTIKVPIRYINIPEKNILTDKLPVEAEIDISGSGYHLLSYRFRPKLAEILVDGRNIGFKKQHGFISTFHAIDYFNRQHGDIKALHINPDTIFFSFIDKGFKKVPVVVNSYLNFEKEFDLRDSLDIRPDSVEVSGSIEKLNKIERVETQPLIARNLNKSGTYSLKIKAPDEQLSYAPAEIAVTVNVDRFTEARITLPVREPNGKTTDPRIVTVVFQVAFSHYDKIKAADFEISTDSTLGSGGKRRLIMKRTPYYAKKINILPTMVRVNP